MIKYLSVGVNPPPLDTKIIVKKSEFNFDDCAHIMTMSSNNWTEESAAEFLLGGGFSLWAEV
jgi:hypothetical protein